jgi:hypothetical protein
VSGAAAKLLEYTLKDENPLELEGIKEELTIVELVVQLMQGFPLSKIKLPLLTI